MNLTPHELTPRPCQRATWPAVDGWAWRIQNWGQSGSVCTLARGSDRIFLLKGPNHRYYDARARSIDAAASNFLNHWTGAAPCCDVKAPPCDNPLGCYGVITNPIGGGCDIIRRTDPQAAVEVIEDDPHLPRTVGDSGIIVNGGAHNAWGDISMCERQFPTLLACGWTYDRGERAFTHLQSPYLGEASAEMGILQAHMQKKAHCMTGGMCSGTCYTVRESTDVSGGIIVREVTGY